MDKLGVNTRMDQRREQSRDQRRGLGTGECLRRLNDPVEQAGAYPILDEFEGSIDLAGTDILHGWRYSGVYSGVYSGPHGVEVSGEPFVDAFANAFRVMTLHRDGADGLEGSEEPKDAEEHGFQPVFRRIGWSGYSWIWGQTNVITSWAIELSSVRGDSSSRFARAEEMLGEERLFPDGWAACERARDILAMSGERGWGLGLCIRAIEIPVGDEARGLEDVTGH
jgi:hypothetical protein